MTQHIQLLQGERLDKVNEDLWLIQKKNGLTFGTDALLLAAFLPKMPGKVALDFGAGTGIVSMLCATRGKFRQIHAIEAQAEFADLIERNAEINRLAARIRSVCRDIRTLSPETLGFEADAVFTNPPYMRADSGKDNLSRIKTIARHEVLGDIADFCAAAARNLKFGGRFFAVYRPDRMSELLCAMQNAGIEPKRLCFVCPDAMSRPSLFLIEGKKGAAAGMRVLPPLLMYTSNAHDAYTDAYAYIYEHGDFPDEIR